MVPRFDVDVIVVNYHDVESTTRTVAAIEADASSVIRRIVIVDNGSTPESAAALASSMPQATIVPLAVNGGFGAGANAALSVCDSPIVMLVNNDARPRPGFTDALVGTLTAAPSDVAAVTARILLAGTYRRTAEAAADDLVSAAGERWTRAEPDDPAGVQLVNSTGTHVSRSGNGLDRSWLTDAAAPEPPSTVFGFSGGAVALRRAAVDAVGGFDEIYFMYFEDLDLGWRLRRHGMRVLYEPSAVIEHDHARSSGVASPLFIRYNTRNRLIAALIHGSPRMIVSAWARSIVHALITIPRGGVRRRATWGGLLSAIGQLPAALRRRRELDRSAIVPRGALRPFAAD
jgi:GT2 family glycosyltransferase